MMPHSSTSTSTAPLSTSTKESRPERRHYGAIYPKNDFGASYQTALDEHGTFRHEMGDRSLLFSGEYPDPGDPLHRLYVDDDYGMFDER